MKHPTYDQWLYYAYGEADAARRLDLDAHLAVCPDCTHQLGEWRSTRAQLDTWTIPDRPAPRCRPAAWRWAAAATITLLLGLAAGRWSVDPQRLREQVASDLRGEFEQRLSGVTTQIQFDRQQDQQITLDLLRQMEARRVTEDAKLRESLETVAVLTQSGFQQANYQMRSLASRAETTAVPAAFHPN